MTDERELPFDERWIPAFKFLLRFGLGFVIAAFYVTASLHFQYTADDTYIYLQYARNIAQGNGFAFNAGQPSLGTTGPAWVLFIAAGTYAGFDPFVVAKTFDVVFASLTVLLAHLVTFLITRDRLYAIAGALLVGADVWLLRWAGSGMETSVAAFVLLMSVRFFVTRDFELSAFGAGFLTLLRPEGILLLALVLFEGARSRMRQNSDWKGAARPFLFAAFPVVPWVVYALLTFGTVLPNTYGAKTIAGFSLTEMFAGGFSAIQIIAAAQLVPALVLTASLVHAIRRHGWRFAWDEASLALIIPILILAYAVLSANVISRYLVPFTPLIPILALWGLKHAELHFEWPWKRSLAILSTVVLIAVAQNIVIYGTVALPHIARFRQGMEECFRPIGYWLRNNTPPDAKVLAHDVGLIAYVSERTVYDTPGLVTPDVRRAFGTVPPDEAMAQGLYRAAVVPDYVVDRSRVPERLAGASMSPQLTLPFPGVGIRSTDTLFYTVYKVEQK